MEKYNKCVFCKETFGLLEIRYIIKDSKKKTTGKCCESCAIKKKIDW